MKLRPLLVLAGAAALVTVAPCAGATRPVPPHHDDASEASALHLLQSAAWSSVMRPWSAVQRIVTIHGGLPRLSAMQVQHVPGRASTMTVVAAPDQEAVTADAQDAALLRVLIGHYDIAFAGMQVLGGRHTNVLEARRPGRQGAGAVAGRFWLDCATGMVLRRDVLDESGEVVRTTSFDLLDVGAAAPVRLAASVSQVHLDEPWLRSMQAQGWPVLRELPGGLDLFDARMQQDVLQLSYSDGLSTVSGFVQPGELDGEPAGTARPVDGGGTVWVSGGSPERLVWSAGGRTWTLISDASESTVTAALQALPHTPDSSGDSPTARIWRGMAVVGGWLNPFE
ncbi:MAG: putative sigma regulatory protein MucB/RseB [Frankiales bacterium]|nr:putative sigma regulatory protein MucB/RseB [Frankiales bacterium]